MKNLLMLFTTIILGLSWGYCLSNYTNPAQIIGATLFFTWLFLLALAYYQNNKHQS
jgi:hypothetical protein